MRSILSILIGLVLCGSACADITTGLIGHWLDSGLTYGSTNSVSDASGYYVDNESTAGIQATSGSVLNGKSDATLEFTFQSTDSKGIIFTHGLASIPLLLAFEDGSSSTSLNFNSGTPALLIDGAPFSGTTRDQLHDALCDGVPHACVLSSIDFTAHANWASDGLYVGGYNTASFNLTATISGLTLDGVKYGHRTATFFTGNLDAKAVSGPGNTLPTGLDFSAGNDVLSLPSAFQLDPTASDYTFAFWALIRADVNSYAGQMSSSSTTGFVIAERTTRRIGMAAYSGGVMLDQEGGSNASHPLGAWMHYVFSWDSSTETFTLYRNGQADTGGVALAIRPAAMSLFGRADGSGIDAAYDDVRVYNRTFTQADAAELYLLGVPLKYLRLRGIGGKLQTINGSPVGVTQ